MLLGRVLAALPRTDAAAVVRDGARTVVAFGADGAVAAHARSVRRPRRPRPAGWWAGYLAYELGHAVERVEPRVTFPDPAVPRSRRSPSCGSRHGSRSRPTVRSSCTGRGPARRALERALAAPVPTVGAPPRAPEWTSSLDRVRLRAPGPRRPGADPRRRVLPGEPHPPPRRTRARPRRPLGRARAPGTRHRTRCSGGRRTSPPPRPRSSRRRPSGSCGSRPAPSRPDRSRGPRPTRGGCERARRTAPRT